MSTSSDRSHAVDGRLSASFLALVYANAFITGAVVMGFEMLGSRYLNPFFGSGIYTWAALISTVLAALTAGYFFGGWMADRNPRPAGLGWLIVGGSAYLALIPLFADGLLDLLTALLGGIKDQHEFERWGSIAGAMLLLFVPLALLGVYSPYAIRLTLRATTRSGTVAGRVYGISTLGSIFGTLFVTFYLIPAMGSRHITYLLSAIGIAAGLSFLLVRPGGARRALPALAALALALFAAPPPSAADTARIELAQATPEPKEAADRFLAYLGKQNYIVRHDGIEAGPPPAGFRFKNFELSEQGKGSWRAAALEIARFEERAGGEAALSGLVAEGLEGTDKDKSSIKVARLAVRSAVWSRDKEIRVDLAGLAVRDIEVVDKKSETVRVASAEAERWRLDVPSGGALERLAVRNFAYSGKGEQVSIATIDAESIAVSLFERTTAKNIALRDIRADRAAQGPVRIAAIELHALDIGNIAQFNTSPGDLRALAFSIRGAEAQLDDARDADFARDMKELGYTAIKVSTAFDYRYDEASKTFNLGKIEIDVADMGAVTLSLKIGGVTPEEIKKALEPPAAKTPPPPQGQRPPDARQGLAAMGLMARLNLIAADLSYRDKSILARVVKREAQKKQTDEASIRAQYRALITGLRDAESDPLVKEAYDVLIAFIENPGELIIEVRPPAPVNFLAIGTLAATSPAQLRSVLGIKITAKKP